MPSTTVTVTGLAELERALKDLDVKVAKNAMRRATAAGGRVFRDLMRQKAPRDKGDLARGIQVSTRADVAHGRFTAKIRPSKKAPSKDKVSPAYEALYNEFGVKPHFIHARGGQEAKSLNKALKLLGGGFFESVEHPGIAPNPFMRNAADEGWPKVIDVFAETLKQGIDDAAGK